MRAPPAGGVVSNVPSKALSVGPRETWKCGKVSIWHAGNHDNPFGLRLTSLMISRRVPDAAVPMSLLADHPNVQFNFLRAGNRHVRRGRCIDRIGLGCRSEGNARARPPRGDTTGEQGDNVVMKRASTSRGKSLTVPDTANANLQNRINTSIIFNYLRDHGFAYRAQIARDLGISAPAVSRAIEKLRRDEYVIESERMPVENGKRAAHISINAGHGLCPGNRSHDRSHRDRRERFLGHDSLLPPGKDRLGIRGFLRVPAGHHPRLPGRVPGEGAGRKARVLAIGIGVPAVVDPRTGAILRASLYERIARTNIKADVQAQFPVPIYVENVSNLGAIGEWKRGVNRNVRNMLFIELGNGIGAGIIMDGDLYRGAEGSAGEIGYFLTELDGLGHDNSRVGFLESMASLGAIREARPPPRGTGRRGPTRRSRRCARPPLRAESPRSRSFETWSGTLPWQR